jgi:hypothetical protein
MSADASPAAFSPELLLGQVLATFAATPDPRLREIMTAAVRHVHAFARNVRLDTLERRAAVRFLTDVGQISNDVPQEFELLSDVLGLSSLRPPAPATARRSRRSRGRSTRPARRTARTARRWSSVTTATRRRSCAAG